ncbi:hypothetical protein PR003_g21352 [Phytophthora rubi]|uniref:Uncharacterized protein n=1 Tax=Phytophthora rubi TaxID=129364 RepID=A0A6A3LMZ2_9STRA|nr:hypothetical protein PR002_g13463 [Phytophthora rubi]KAE9021474.1 hypothetical protein PR001_g13366 [Phytophthora rubi]KAE9305971.1 hypothetical protein PR003_g21352 [Phytophthora rubi]
MLVALRTTPCGVLVAALRVMCENIFTPMMPVAACSQHCESLPMTIFSGGPVNMST